LIVDANDLEASLGVWVDEEVAVNLERRDGGTQSGTKDQKGGVSLCDD